MFTKHHTRTTFRAVGLLAFALLVFILSACSNPLSAQGNTTSTGANALTTTTANANLLAVLPILQRSLQATEQLKTVHVALTGKGTIQTSGPLLPSLATVTPYSVSGSADIDVANQAGKARTTLKLLPAQGATLAIKNAARLVGGQLYVPTSTHQWFVLNVANTVAFVEAHVNLTIPQPQALLALAGHVTVTDAGMTTIGNLQTHHITLSIDQGAFGQIANSAPQQVQRVLANIQLTNALTADLFIDSATSHLMRLEIKGGVRLNIDGLLAATGHSNMLMPGSQARMFAFAFDFTLTFSKFDQPAPQITAPPNATPLDLMNVVLPHVAG
jgi:hypothetical protein